MNRHTLQNPMSNFLYIDKFSYENMSKSLDSYNFFLYMDLIIVHEKHPDFNDTSIFNVV
jgi:hypothetical protein